MLTVVLLASGSYKRLEGIMLVLVFGFTLITMVCAVLMQGTQYAVTWEDVASGFEFEFSTAVAVLALAAYGYTGVNSGEISAYSYWCIEKGYPARIGVMDGSDAWRRRAHGWLRVLRLDVVITLLLLTSATIPFYFLGAGVLHETGQTPEGSQTITALSNMFTQTLGPWSLWVFGAGAFAILFSSTLAAVAGGGRYIPDYLIEMGFMDRARIDLRRNIIRGYAMIVPFVGLALYAGIQRPVLMVTIAASFAAIMLPIQCGVTIYLQHKRLPPEVQPKAAARWLLRATFVLQFVLALCVVYFVVL